MEEILETQLLIRGRAFEIFLTTEKGLGWPQEKLSRAEFCADLLYMNMLCIPHFSCKRRKLIGLDKVKICKL